VTAARQSWLAKHPWLAPIARFEAVVQEAIARVDAPRLESPRWDGWVEAIEAGVPLLRCGAAGLRCAPAAGFVLGRAAERCAETLRPGPLADAAARTRDELGRDPERLAAAIEWAVAGAPGDGAPAHPGLLRLLAWRSVRHVLAPLLDDPAAARARDLWARGSCPTCGSLPALAHLRPRDGARVRFLACACCGTRWRHDRLRCPRCASAGERLRALEVEGDDRLRIDACDGCKGYVKTYVGEGEEDLFLSDWSTLHLDLLAVRRGFRRLGASLYDIPDEGGMAA
jgi:FdhE protein